MTAPGKQEREWLARQIEQARKALAKPLDNGPEWLAARLGEMEAHLGLLIEAAEPFAGGGGRG